MVVSGGVEVRGTVQAAGTTEGCCSARCLLVCTRHHQEQDLHLSVFFKVKYLNTNRIIFPYSLHLHAAHSLLVIESEERRRWKSMFSLQWQCSVLLQSRRICPSKSDRLFYSLLWSSSQSIISISAG